MSSFVKGFKLLVVNALWVICSLPIFTIGASSCAACYVCLKLLNEEDGNVVSWFFKSFKENFKQGTIIWLFIAPAFYAVTLCWGLLTGDDAEFFGKMGCLAFILVFAVSMIFIFPLMAHYHNTIKVFVRNSFLLGLQYLTKTLIAVILAALVFILWSLTPKTMIAGIFFMPGLLFFIMSFYANPIFQQLDNKKKVVEEDACEEDDGDESEEGEK